MNESDPSTQPGDAGEPFAPGTGFNIAAAFPPTDQIMRRARIERLRHQLAVAADFLSKPAVVLSLAAGVAGILAVGLLKRRSS